MQVAIVALSAIAVVFAFATQMLGGLNPDVSWLLTVGERMLAGRQLYVDIYELNPPMSALLYLPMVALGGGLSLPPEPLVIGAILLLTLVSLGFSVIILRQSGLIEKAGLWWLVSLLALALLPGDNFGEREHIAVILLLPMLSLATLYQRGRSPTLAQSLIAGLAAGLAMTIKPHFALPILVVALFGAVRARSWRPIFNLPHVIAGVLLLAYWLAVWLWFPGFFDTMLPIAADAYVADRRPLLALAFNWLSASFWLMLAGLAILYRNELGKGPLGAYLAAAAGFFLVYLIQGKGFIYHLLPAQLLVSLVFAYCFVLRNAVGRLAPLNLGLAVALLAYPSVFDIRGEGWRNEMREILQPLGPGLKIANLTSQLEIASPLHRDLGATLVNSGPCLWITLGAIRRRATITEPAVNERLKELEAFERSQLRADLLANPPDIILSGGDRFDWMAWARQDAQLADVLSEFTLMASVGPGPMALQIYQRDSSQ